MTFVKDAKWDRREPSAKLPIGDRDKQLMADYLKAGLGMGKLRDDLLVELAEKYRRSPRQIERYIARFSRPEADLTHEETPHKHKIRELAKTLAREINIPAFWDKDLLRDLPVEFKKGKYSLPIGNVEIGRDRQIKMKYHDIGVGIAAPYLVKGLYSHLSTSGLSKFARIMGDKGKLNSLVVEIEQYSQALLGFLKLIVEDVEEYRVEVNFHDELKPGLTKWFITIVWNDAIQKAGGHSWVDDSWYKPHESITGTNLWQLRCGAYGIGIARSDRTLKTYENWHKKLRAKYAAHRSAGDINYRNQEMGDYAKDIRQRLQEFSDMERLPGRCELC